MEASAEMKEKARAKLRGEGMDPGTRFLIGPPSVAAVFDREVVPSGQDGARWRMFVSDGDTDAFVALTWSGTNGGKSGMDVDPVFLEAEVEHEAGTFPRERRIQGLLSQGEVAIRRDRLPDAT
jgi:hypothetical protein